MIRVSRGEIKVIDGRDDAPDPDALYPSLSLSHVRARARSPFIAVIFHRRLALGIARDFAIEAAPRVRRDP